MYQIDFNKPVHIHFIGIGGISMSGLAELLHTKGFTVTGSDVKSSKITEHLCNLGIEISYIQQAANITADIDVCVYTAAVKSNNLEYMKAKSANIPLLDRACLVGQVMSHYNNAISVAGTHGKTTTTSMLSLIMMEGDCDPTVSVGGILDMMGGNIRIGNSDNFIVESCEYTNSFLKFNPTHEIILNIEAEHLDFFKDEADVRHSFRLFAEKLPAAGNLIINGEIHHVDEIISNLPCHVFTYGIYKDTVNSAQTPTDYDYVAANLSFDDLGCGSYDLFKQGTFVDRISLAVVGTHNISNSLSAIALADQLGISVDACKKALLKFKGTKRRFEYKGSIGGVTIIDDYAHHPTEIEATLTASHAYPHKDIWCVFQPHTYTRTKSLLKDFAKALSYADKIVLADIYAAREENPGDISSIDLQLELQKLGKSVYYYPSFHEIENFLLENCTNGDLLITMGAGDVVSIGESLLGQ